MLFSIKNSNIDDIKFIRQCFNTTLSVCVIQINVSTLDKKKMITTIIIMHSHIYTNTTGHMFAPTMCLSLRFA